MVKHFALSGFAQCFLGLAILAMGSQTALADTTTLLCDEGNNSSVTLALDQAAGKVTMTFSPLRNFPQAPIRPPVTLAATFAPNEIHFSEKPDEYRSFDYSVNRSTAIISVTEINGGTPYHHEWTCQVSKPQF
jgi:hypothetical protein